MRKFNASAVKGSYNSSLLDIQEHSASVICIEEVHSNMEQFCFQSGRSSYLLRVTCC